MSLQADFGVQRAFTIWYVYALTEAIISDFLIPVGIFLNMR